MKCVRLRIEACAVSHKPDILLLIANGLNIKEGDG
jgi:hypothetical protein